MSRTERSSQFPARCLSSETGVANRKTAQIGGFLENQKANLASQEDLCENCGFVAPKARNVTAWAIGPGRLGLKIPSAEGAK